MKLFIARTSHFANFTADKLGLDRSEWFVAGIGQALAGRRFTDYVDITDGPLSEREAEWLKHALMKCDSYARKPAKCASDTTNNGLQGTLMVFPEQPILVGTSTGVYALDDDGKLSDI